MSTPAVYRAPMRSRRDDVPGASTVARALRRGVVGIGGVLSRTPTTVSAAVELTYEEHDERFARRLERFAGLADGTFVWTRSDAGFHVGRITGPWGYDSSAEAVRLDLVNVRPCDWSAEPVVAPLVPEAVRATFARGGRNLQRIHPAGVEADTVRAWDRLSAAVQD